MKFRKRPVVIEAHRWLKNGDHPEDKPTLIQDEVGEAFLTEGKVVRRFRRPEVKGASLCKECARTMHVHGWIDTLEGGHNVCPGDWIITGIKGERYPIKDHIFRETYDEVHDA